MPIGCIYVLDAVNEVVVFSRGDWFPQEYFFIFFYFCSGHHRNSRDR